MYVCFIGPRIYLFALSTYQLWGWPSVTLLCVLRIDTWHKLSYYKPGQAPRAQDVEAPRIYRHSAHGDGQFVSPRHWPSLTRRRYSWYSFMLETESTPGPYCGPEGLSHWTQSGIETATFPLVARCLNELHRCVPSFGIRPFRNPRSGWKNKIQMNQPTRCNILSGLLHVV